MIRVMLDTDDLAVLTDAVPLLATYSDLVSDPAALRRQYPHAQLLLIDRGNGDPSGEATIADVETGALSPADVPGILDRWNSRGVRYPTIYCDRANLPAVDAAAGKRVFYRWVATLDGTCHIDGYPAMVAPTAVQALGEAQLGIHADLSLVFESSWHPQPVPEWELRARNDGAVLLADINHVQREANALMTLVSAKH